MTLCPHCQSKLTDTSLCPDCGYRHIASLETSTYGPPTVAGDLLFLLSGKGAPTQHTALLAFDLSVQEVRWRCRLENALVNYAPLVHDDTLYVATRSTDPQGQGLLLALDAASGEDRWRWVPGAQAISAPVVTGDTLYVTLDGDQLWAVNPETGKQGWQVRLPMPRSIAAPAASPDLPHLLFLPSRGPHLCAVNITRQEIGWYRPSPQDSGDWFLATPALAGERLLATSSGGAVLALDAATGKRLWRAVPGKAGKPLTAPVADSQRIYAGGRDHCVYALDVSSGETLWRYETARRIEGRPLLLENILYVTGHDHHLRALEAATGVEMWHIKLPRRIKGGPVMAGNLVLAADRAGNIVAVEGESTEKPQDYLQIAADYAAAGDWAEAGKAYERAGKPELAAPAFKKAGLFACAVDNYCQAEMWDEAAHLYETQKQWAGAADCYGKANRWADAGRIQSTHLNDPASAAKSFVRAAQSSIRRYPAEIANLWEQAGHCYRQLKEVDKTKECQLEVARLRGLPYIQIQVRVETPEAVTLGEHCRIDCLITNLGGGTARRVFLHHTESKFAGDLENTMDISDVPKSESVKKVFYLIPQIAGRGPLDIIVTYADDGGQTYELRHRKLLTVHRNRPREQNRNEEKD